MDRISVALCSYNGASHLAEQLASLSRQSRAPDQLVIVDDCSADHSVAIAREFAARASFPVEVFENPVNLGYRANFERALRLCTGDVIALCDQDDVWVDDKLEQIEAALADSGAGLVFSDAVLVDAQLRPTGRTLWEAVEFTPRLRRSARLGQLSETLVSRSVVTGATMAFSRRWLPLVLPIEEPADHDAWIALLISMVDAVTVIDEPLILYRQHSGNQIGARKSSVRQKWERARRERFTVLERHRRICSRALDRLKEQGVVNERTRRLARAVRDLEARAELPHSRLARALAVARLLSEGGYGPGGRAVVRAIGDVAGDPL